MSDLEKPTGGPHTGAERMGGAVVAGIFALLLFGALVRYWEDLRAGRELLAFLILWGLTLAHLALPGLLVAGGAWGWGRMAIWGAGGGSLKVFRDLGPLERGVFCLAAGFAVMPVIVVLAGHLGGGNGWGMGAVAMAGLLAGWIPGRGPAKPRRGVGNHGPDGWPAAWMGRLIGILLAAAGVLLALGASSPPLVFDVTEYHLGAFSDFAAAGGFVAVPHNFYARFPFPVQSLYYASLWIGGGWHLEPGGWSDLGPKLVNGVSIAGAAGLAAAWAGRAVDGGAGRRGWAPGLAALLVLAQPVMLEVSLDAYIDGPVAFLCASAVYGLHLSLPGGVGLRMMPVAGLCVGAALASKYTVAQHWAVPAFLVFGIPVLWRAWRIGGRGRGLVFLSLALTAMPAAFWLGRNWLLYGNPVEPFASGWFHGRGSLAAQREAYYVASHFPQPPWTAGYWATLPCRLGGVDTVALALMTGAWLALWLRPHGEVGGAPRGGRRTAPPLQFPMGRALLFVLLAYAMWNTIRESQQRFLLPLAPLLAVGAVVALSTPLLPRVVRFPGFAIVLAFTTGALVFQTLKIGHAGIPNYLWNREANNRPGQRERLRDYYSENLAAIGRVAGAAHQLPPDSRLLLVFEARPYLFPLNARYCTIWDADPLLAAAVELRDRLGRAPTPEDLRRALVAAGLTHVVVNREELLRYIRQYARPGQYRRAGIDPVEMDQDPAVALFLSSDAPEDHYPPYLNAREWPALRGTVAGFLRQTRARASTVEGRAPFEVWLAPLAGPDLAMERGSPP